jgi:hypothetical protein
LAGAALMLFGGDLASLIGALALVISCSLGTVTLLQPADLVSSPLRDEPRRSP